MLGMGFMQGEANICNGQYLTRSFGNSNGGLTLQTDPNSGQYGKGGHYPRYGIDRRCVEYFSWSIFDATVLRLTWRDNIAQRPIQRPEHQRRRVSWLWDSYEVSEFFITDDIH